MAAVLLAASACGGDPATDAYVAEYVPFATSGVDTDLIFPRESGASRFLFRNWPPIQSLRGNTIWVHGSWARIGFNSVADQPPELVFEARPLTMAEAPTQVVTFRLNDTEIDERPMPPRWESYVIDLPAELVRVGWNVIELDFLHAPRPSDLDPESEDGRTLTAQFRRIEMRSAAGRPYMPDRVEHVRLADLPPMALTSDEAAVATGASGAAMDPPEAASSPVDPPEAESPTRKPNRDIEMPADSFLEVYAKPGPDGRIVGTVAARFAPDTDQGTVNAVIDVVRPDGTATTWSAALSPRSAEAEVDAALGEWAGDVVGLRLRVFGSANGTVSWRDLRLTGAATPDALVHPEDMTTPPRSAALGHPDVFLIILDAARGDVFEGERGAELTPNVRAMAADGTTFTGAWAPSSWTGQTIPSLWSGRAPDTVGIENWGSRLPPTVTTFPEVLHEAGYHTQLWSQHNIYRARTPLRHGFEVFDEVDSADLTQRVVLPSVVDLIDEDRSTLAVVHLLPPHAPYQPPEPFSGSRSSWYSGEPITAHLLNQFDARFPPEDAELRDEVRRAALAMYEENVRFADHLVGRLLDDLRQQQRYDDALIIVTADHGEAFYEHGRFLHTSRLYEEYVHVPLVIKWPSSFTGFEPRVDTPVSLLDLAPTLIDGLGIEDERTLYQGRTLLPLVTGAAASDRILYAYTSGETDPERDPKPVYAVRWNDIKLIHDARYDETELYRLSDDPGEAVDLAQHEEFYARWLLQTLRLSQARNAAHLLEAGGARQGELDEETARALRALGYLR